MRSLRSYRIRKKLFKCTDVASGVSTEANLIAWNGADNSETVLDIREWREGHEPTVHGITLTAYGAVKLYEQLGRLFDEQVFEIGPGDNFDDGWTLEEEAK